MDRSIAEAYVRELFEFVLLRESVSEEEVSHWTNELIAGRSTIEVFHLFASSEENKSRLQRLQGCNRRYPDGHFYSPIVDVQEIELDRDRIFGNRVPNCVDLRDSRQVERFAVLSEHLRTMPFSDQPDGVHRYRYDNTSFGFGDACIYWGMLASLRPKRIIEVGCGFTSALALDAIDHLGLPTVCTFIDPHPELLIKVAAPIDPRHEVVAERVQRIDLAMLDQLGVDDLLFIDSSHVVKSGSDVHFEITEMLPRLRPGVIVHFHDIFYPFEYPYKWVAEENNSWNEIYFLHAFLMGNPGFEIVFFNDYFAKVHSGLVQGLPQGIASRILLNPGGGLWLRRV